MTIPDEILAVLAAYPADCRPVRIEPWVGGGFSGARLWRIESPRGPLCLRRWPAEHPAPEQLEFIQAVLWHVAQEGFRLVPVPVETHNRTGYVRHRGHLWQLEPWLAGRADYRASPTFGKLQNALRSLAQFHNAAATFPLPDTGPAPSPGILRRHTQLTALLAGGADTIAAAIGPRDWPRLATLGQQVVAGFAQAAEEVLAELERAATYSVGLQPCIRDIWHEHVLFENDRVVGLIDFGAMRGDSEATDIARLLGSLVADNHVAWQIGLTAYNDVRSLSAVPLELVRAFDRSGVLMSGMQWLQWIYVDGRVFSDRAAVEVRLEEILARLVAMSG